MTADGEIVAVKPEEQRAACERLRRAARYIRNPTCGSRRALTEAALTIKALLLSEVAGDVTRDLHEIMDPLTERGGSIGETIEDLLDEQVEALGRQVVELYENTCR